MRGQIWLRAGPSTQAAQRYECEQTARSAAACPARFCCHVLSSPRPHRRVFLSCFLPCLLPRSATAPARVALPGRWPSSQAARPARCVVLRLCLFGRGGQPAGGNDNFSRSTPLHSTTFHRTGMPAGLHQQRGPRRVPGLPHHARRPAHAGAVRRHRPGVAVPGLHQQHARHAAGQLPRRRRAPELRPRGQVRRVPARDGRRHERQEDDRYVQAVRAQRLQRQGRVHALRAVPRQPGLSGAGRHVGGRLRLPVRQQDAAAG